MKLQKSESRNFEIPEEGTGQAVVVDVIDLGLKEDKFSPGEMVHQLTIALQTEDETSEGKPFLVRSYPFRASTNSKSNLYKAIKLIIGRDLEDTDFDSEGDVDLDALLIGRNVNVTIQHNTKGDKTYANVVDFGALTKSQVKAALLEPRDYVRVQDREEKNEDSD